jgi:3-aminobutyryl-CoA ammonia-lyase
MTDQHEQTDQGDVTDEDERVGLTVVHRLYVSFAQAHYAGNLVDGAFSLARFGDVATEICIRTDGDEGLFASYSDVQFRAAIRAGDVLEVTGRVISVGRRSRRLEFTAAVICRGRPDLGISAAEALAVPIVASTAIGTVVVPASHADTPSEADFVESAELRPGAG